MTWADHFHVATGRLKVPPSDFWAMTPMELTALITAHFRAQPGYVAPMSVDTFEALKARFGTQVRLH